MHAEAHLRIIDREWLDPNITPKIKTTYQLKQAAVQPNTVWSKTVKTYGKLAIVTWKMVLPVWKTRNVATFMASTEN